MDVKIVVEKADLATFISISSGYMEVNLDLVLFISTERKKAFYEALENLVQDYCA